MIHGEQQEIRKFYLDAHKGGQRLAYSLAILIARSSKNINEIIDKLAEKLEELR